MIGQDLIKRFDERFGRLERSQVKYRQGVVTDDSPLAVDLGASGVSVLATSLTPGLQTGATVHCLQWGNDVLVLGSSLGVAAPCGSLIATGRSSAPQGWLLCDGSAISRTTYADLFTAISTTYGTGDGSTTFNIPDLRGRVPVGVDGSAGRIAADDALGNSSGYATHTLTTAEIPAHSHQQLGGLGGGGLTTLQVAAGLALYGVGNTGNNTGGGGAHNNLQPYQVVNWIVKT